MKKLIAVLIGFIGMTGAAFAQSNAVIGTENGASSGTASATTFVPAKAGFVQITDLNWRLDTGVNTGLIGIYRGDAKLAVTSGTSASGSVLWFNNAGSQLGLGQYVIYYCSASGTYYLRQITAVTTISVTVGQSIADATTTNDFVWSVANGGQPYYRPVTNSPSPTNQSVSLWLPALTPTAITIEGNTTACRIQWSGVRAASK